MTSQVSDELCRELTLEAIRRCQQDGVRPTLSRCIARGARGAKQRIESVIREIEDEPARPPVAIESDPGRPAWVAQTIAEARRAERRVMGRRNQPRLAPAVDRSESEGGGCAATG